MWITRSDYVVTNYVDGRECYIFCLLPHSLIPIHARRGHYTEIGMGWVRREALDLLNYSYKETKSGRYSINGVLSFVGLIHVTILSVSPQY